MNPIALALMILGMLLITLGIFLRRRRLKVAAGVVALVGVVLVALPLVVTASLAR